jgi:hypothetical protein
MKRLFMLLVVFLILAAGSVWSYDMQLAQR